MKVIAPRGTPVAERLRLYSQDGPGGCRLWMGSLDIGGYGMIWARGRSRRAHVMAWQEASGKTVPAGKVVCHSCDVRNCINPDHLWVGTQLDNVRDRDRKGRRVAPQGEAHGSATITEEDVRRIRLDPRPHVHVAPDYNLDHTTISLIRRRKLWKHVA